MPKYWVKHDFTHGRFPEVGQKQKTERKKERREKKRPNDGNNNGQATHGARKPPGPIWDPKKIGTQIFGLKKIRSRKKFGGQKNSDTKAIWSQRKFPSIS